jgi:ADP-ribose pyrophosphatase
MDERPGRWETIASKQIADCRVFKVREDIARSEGREASFYVIENPDWVNVVALTKNNNVVLIEQFRHGTGEMVLEIPGGMIDSGEPPEEAAARELLEETGYSSEEFIFLGKSYPNPALQDNTIHHFLALDCEKTAETSFDEHESIVTRLYPLGEVPELVSSGSFTHSLAITAFYYLSLRK